MSIYIYIYVLNYTNVYVKLRCTELSTKSFIVSISTCRAVDIQMLSPSRICDATIDMPKSSRGCATVPTLNPKPSRGRIPKDGPDECAPFQGIRRGSTVDWWKVSRTWTPTAFSDVPGV